MPREKEGFREQLEQLNKHFPEQDMLNRTDIMNFTGKKQYWMDHHGFKGRRNFTKQEAARLLISAR